MERLREVNHQSLKVLMRIINKEEIEGRRIVKLWKEINYREGCHLTAQDEERDKEIALWNSIESPIDGEE